MKTLGILIFLNIFLQGVCISQGRDSTSRRFLHKNSIQIDLGGPGVFYSLNYERIIINHERFKTTVQAGMSYYPPISDMLGYSLFPVSINEFFTFRNSHIELGLGCTFEYGKFSSYPDYVEQWNWETWPNARLGYRFQKPNGRFVFRAAFIPFIEYRYVFTNEIGPKRIFIEPWGGLSFGYAF